MVKVELIYITADKSLVHHQLSLHLGACVSDALEASGILITHPEVAHCSIGIFSKQVTLETLLVTGDRIEIYRALTLDPKEKRRQRAKNRKN